ncbi:skin secretory protein xP2-like isoform X1 [Frankliniella occidentalis]|uniref:Skin secretory protein xP2-like isoform X1 n=1 Tax=Frankliniella occidentalis TaxID=133901 RepID=A0A6J1TDV9_FRAOC|nr:skin secretory protein xP2-like isoform X1 [Frankliniella occidentalis]
MVPLRRCSSLRRRPCSGADCTDANYRETVARLRMLLMDSYLPCRLESAGALVGKSSAGLADFIERQEEYIQQLEKESRYCRSSLCAGCPAGRADRPHDQAQGPHLGERGAHERRAGLSRAGYAPASGRYSGSDGGYTLLHGPDPAGGCAHRAARPWTRAAVRVPHLRAAGAAHAGAHGVAVAAPPPWRLRPAPAVIPPLTPWPWPDPLGVWWGHLGWQRAELRAAPAPAEDPEPAAADTDAEAPRVDDGELTTSTTASITAQEKEDEAEEGESRPEEQHEDHDQPSGAPDPPPAPETPRRPSLDAPPEALALPQAESRAGTRPSTPRPPSPEPSSSSADSAASTGDGADAEGRQLLALSVPLTEEQAAKGGHKPVIRVNVEVKFHVKDKKDKKRKKSSSNDQP